MTTYYLSMTTTERAQPTILRSLDSLTKNYKGTINVVEDVEPRLGCFKNFDKALRVAINSGADIVGVIPDDILITADFQDVITEKVLDHNTGYVALYTPKGLGQRYKFKRGWNEVKGGWASSWGGCYMMRNEVAQQLIEQPFYIAHLNGTLKDTHKLHNYAYNKRIDHCVPEVMHRIGLKQMYYAPSLCEHIGHTSTIGHKHTNAENSYMR